MTTNSGDSPAFDSASAFFDEIVHHYDEAIYRCVPRYDEMLDQMLDYVSKPHPRAILELGCGSGNLTSRLLSRYPDAEIIGVDASGEMIQASRNRFHESNNLRFQQTTFQSLKFANDSFDLVVSSISIHHLQDAEKLQLFQEIESWLLPGGIFTFCDQFAGETDELYAKHIDHWKKESLSLGATNEEWNDWMNHQQAHDHHSSLQTHLNFLNQSGFEKVDCTRRHFLWTTLIAESGAGLGNKQD